MFYLLQHNIILQLRIVKMFKQFSLKFCEAGTGGLFDILNLDITDGGHDSVTT